MLVSQSQTLYLPLLSTWGGKGLAHTNRARFWAPPKDLVWRVQPLYREKGSGDRPIARLVPFPQNPGE